MYYRWRKNDLKTNNIVKTKLRQNAKCKTKIINLNLGISEPKFVLGKSCSSHHKKNAKSYEIVNLSNNR